MKEAKYQVVEDYIIQQISDGTLKPGDKIMTEEQLTNFFGFSRMTINKAINNLCNEGYIVRTAGKGSFVTLPHISIYLGHPNRFSDSVAESGLEAGSKLLSYELKRAVDLPEIAKQLMLGDNDYIHHFKRLRTGNSAPLAISSSYVSARLIESVDVQQATQSLFGYLKKNGIERCGSKATIKSWIATEEENKILQTTHGNIICTEVVSFTKVNGVIVPFEFSVNKYNSESYVFITSAGEII